MKNKALKLILLASTLLANIGQADNISPQDPNIRYVGRILKSNPSAPRMYWSGSHIIAWFEGTSCKVRLNSNNGNDFFNIIINDGKPVKYDLSRGLQTITAASGLSNGVHKIEIFKRTSFQSGNTAFQGFVTDPGKRLAPLKPAPKAKLQIYGDSISEGYSVDSTEDTGASINQNNYLAYGAVTARNLGMQYVCTAASGIAVVKGYSPGFVMKNTYDTFIPRNRSSLWNFAGDDTDIVVVNLFQNDRWTVRAPHNAATRNNILNTYEDLIVKIRAAHPKAQIICALGNMDATASGMVWPGYVRTVAQRRRNAGDSKVHSLIFPYKNRGGHPIASEQKLMADRLTSYIRQNFPGILQGSNPPVDPPANPGTPATSSLIGKVISLKGNNGRYVSSENGRGPINCNRNRVGSWEKFTVTDAGGGKINLKGNNGRYISSENGTSSMTCNRTSPSNSETFTVISTGPSEIALKGNNGKYVASENGTRSMNCNRAAIGSWEKFKWKTE